MAVVLVALAHPALADDAGAPPVTFHAGQVGFSARFGIGYQGLAPRNDEVYCGETDPTARHGYAPICTGRAPLAIDLEASYGVARHVELVFAMRFGLEQNAGSTPQLNDGSRPLQIAPGARFFFSEAAHTKLFFQPMAVFDVANQPTTIGTRGTEYAVRGLEGYWIDLHRAYGFYFYVGETLAVSPWLQGEIEAGFGLQGRYP